MFRLIIDVPMGNNLEEAIQGAEALIEEYKHSLSCENTQAKLVQDGDRNGRNFLNYDPETDRYLTKKLPL